MVQGALTLSLLLGLVKTCLQDAFPDPYWVMAEIVSIRDHRGHIFFELAEKYDDSLEASAQAVIWARDAKHILPHFLECTGAQLREGMKVMVLAKVDLHPVHGLKLHIRDIDPTYSLGELARRRREVLERLVKEGIIDSNKELPFPLVPQRVAVVSSPQAAGYGDFIAQLENNSYGYRFHWRLFPALMQGEEAEKSLLEALAEIHERKEAYDTVVIIRGGGAQIDLSCFDGYHLARAVACFSCPVLAGIGHQRDQTVLDMVAHKSLKTPTAVADCLVETVHVFEGKVDTLYEAFRACMHEKLLREQRILDERTRSFSSVLENRVKNEEGRLTQASVRFRVSLERKIEKWHSAAADMERRLNRQSREVFPRFTGVLERLEQAVHHLDPISVLRRGYSITSHEGKALRDAGEISPGQEVHTRLLRGALLSRVEECYEE